MRPLLVFVFGELTRPSPSRRGLKLTVNGCWYSLVKTYKAVPFAKGTEIGRRRAEV